MPQVEDIDGSTLQGQTPAGMYPLSFNQRDMWFQRQIHGEGGLNNVSARVLLAGELEVDRWRQALQSVVNRHDGLRTVFVEGEGTPYQQVLTEVKVEFVQMD
ncbi:MAG TPA: condensation domain-containing protein, partial [Candidatus Polarisedimenticolia bacterium]|nr:condensation domain-containing protein [Candidatus Polarisedimenticolia bacterium]